ncbi:hypothetical protein CLU79DRAFT_835134 [Phycomyces nitens]|nr:hypothetical protein CLU79DRAFT_835134 [Phycomyces nitens]
MHKLKSTFLRTKDVEERRSQQFVKRHSNLAQPPLADEKPCGPPSISLGELSEREQQAYRAWWKDLDPFGLGRLENKTALVFLSDCGLPDKKLEEILQLFQDAVGGLSEIEFYALLRLIAHAQNGRQISRDLIFLGAPVPRFHMSPIEALIKPAVPRRTTPPPEPLPGLNSNTEKPSWATSTRKSWWGQQLHAPNGLNGGFQTQEPFQSPPLPIIILGVAKPTTPAAVAKYTVTVTDTVAVADTTTDTDTATATITITITATTTTTTTLTATATATFTFALTLTATSTSIASTSNLLGNTTSITPSIDFIPEVPPIDRENDPPTAKPPLLTSHSAIDSVSFERLNSTGIDTGQSLLLTKKFVYKPKSTNPFDNEYDEPTPKSTPRSPFDDNGPLGNDSTTSLSSNTSSIATRQINSNPNQQNIPPPPVPAQTTKPAFPRYSRNSQPSLLKRSQSHGAKTATVQTMYETLSVGNALFNDSRLSRHKSMGSYISNR